MKKSIDWYIYKQRNKYEWAVDYTCCRYNVHNDYGVGFHQCTRNSKYEIDGYEFCTQHKNLIEKHRKRKNE